MALSILELPLCDMIHQVWMLEWSHLTPLWRLFLFITDVLADCFHGVRIIHHNTQGLLSKPTDVYQWLSHCAGSASIFCFSETWIKPDGPLLSVAGYQVFDSPFLLQSNVANDDRFLPGSCLFVPELLLSQHPPLCVDIEQSCVSLNVSCCFSKIMSKF